MKSHALCRFALILTASSKFRRVAHIIFLCVIIFTMAEGLVFLALGHPHPVLFVVETVAALLITFAMAAVLGPFLALEMRKALKTPLQKSLYSFGLLAVGLLLFCQTNFVNMWR